MTNGCIRALPRSAAVSAAARSIIPKPVEFRVLIWQSWLLGVGQPRSNFVGTVAVSNCIRDLFAMQLVLDKPFCPAQCQIHEKGQAVSILRDAIHCLLGGIRRSSQHESSRLTKLL